MIHLLRLDYKKNPKHKTPGVEIQYVTILIVITM